MPMRVALKPNRRVCSVASLLAATALAAACCQPRPSSADGGKGTEAAVPLPAGCTGPAKATGEQPRRLLALLVGVGDYGAADKLLGPRSDVETMRRVLVERFGFPAENVCALVDRQATTASFRRAFDAALVDRAQPGDVAVFYFSGHGSQAPDENKDEPDGWDETILLQDARVGEVKDLVDDELNGMIARLYAKTENVSVLLDSCNSGTATRAAAAGTARVRYQRPAAAQGPRHAGPTAGLEKDFLPTELERAVVFAAAADGTSALEIDGRGVFTTAFLQAISETGKGPLTWSAVARRIPDYVRASSPQVPYFHGDLDRDVFGTQARPRPPSWEVRSVGPPVELAGPPTPGMGVGAELRVYAAGLTPAQYADPGNAKGVLVIQPPFTGVNARATFTPRPGADPLVGGELAILVRPADESLRISVRIRPDGEPGGIDAATARRLRDEISKDRDAATSVVVVDGRPGAFELSRAGDTLVLRGPEDGVRNVYASASAVPRSLWQHARQRALLALRPEGGEDFVANESLEVRLEPAGAKDQTECGKRALGQWAQSPPNRLQVLPLCAAWKIHVKLQRSAVKPVLVGGVILSSDGATFGFPRSDARILLQPGEETTLPDLFVAKPPLDIEDTIRVFGTQESNPVSWRLLTQDAKARSAQKGAYRGALHGALERYISVGKRGVGEGTGPVEDTTWTATSLAARVEANARFAQPEGAAAPPRAREYTIRDFDLRPYRGDDPTTALDRVLAKGDELARMQVGYRQHPWAAATDAENLRTGIDCSRAVWFAFTRAGLRYNERSPKDGERRPEGYTKDYLTTAEMVAPNTPMADLFERCSPSDPRLGDLLVYRDDVRGDGHVVMVIDAPKRIAWGAHGWDGNAAELAVAPATGVEFQRIKYKPDWERWDRKNMEAKACWRYKAFARELAAGKGPGVKALADPCSPRSCPRTTAPSVVGSN